MVAFHAHVPFASSGFLGVDLFFILSGFLITRILGAEFKASDTIVLKNFYIRRALRLYPNLLIMLAAYALFATALSLDEPVSTDILWASLYISDYSRAFLGEPKMIGHTWSLAVEEHFYLLWPLIIPFVIRAKRPMRLLLLAFAIATMWRVMNLLWLGWDATYFRFDTRLSGLILGSALAFAKLEPSEIQFKLAALIGATAFCIPSYGRLSGLTISTAVAELCALVMVAYVINNKVKLLENYTLIYLGKISYGIYLWHFPIAYYLRNDFHWIVTFSVSLGLSIIFGALVYHFIENPIRTIYRDKAKLLIVPAAT